MNHRLIIATYQSDIKADMLVVACYTATAKPGNKDNCTVAAWILQTVPQAYDGEKAKKSQSLVAPVAIQPFVSLPSRLAKLCVPGFGLGIRGTKTEGYQWYVFYLRVLMAWFTLPRLGTILPAMHIDRARRVQQVN